MPLQFVGCLPEENLSDPRRCGDDYPKLGPEFYVSADKSTFKKMLLTARTAALSLKCPMLILHEGAVLRTILNPE